MNSTKKAGASEGRTLKSELRSVAFAVRAAVHGSSRASLVIAFGCALFALSLLLPVSGKTVNNIAYALVLAPALLACLGKADRLLYLATDCLPLLVFLLAVLGLAVVHASGLAGVKPAIYILFFAVAVTILAGESQHLDRFVFVALAALSGVMLVGAGAEWLLYLLEHGYHHRTVLAGRSANPIYAGLLVVSAAVFGWVHLAEPKLGQGKAGAQFVGLTVLAAVCLVAIVVFQARSALLGLLLFLAFYAVFRSRIRLLVVLMGCVAVILTVTGAADAILVRGLSYRPEIWADAMQRLANECNVWIGCGKTDELFAGQFWGSHSGYVGTVYRYGLLGALAFIVFACWYFAISIRARSRWFLVSLVGWGGMLTAMDGFIGSPDAWWMFFWFPTVAAIVESQRTRRRATMAT